jgi:hypothetical protein
MTAFMPMPKCPWRVPYRDQMQKRRLSFTFLKNKILFIIEILEPQKHFKIQVPIFGT